MGEMDDSSERPPPRPSPPKRKPESIVIEAKAHEARGFAATTVGLTAGAFGGLIGAGLALAAAWLLTSPTDLRPLEARLTALEGRAAAAGAADARLGALESAAKAAGADARASSDVDAGLAGRIAALEGAHATADAERKADAEATQDIKTAIAALRRDLAAGAQSADVAQTRAVSAGLERRLAALEDAAVRSDALAPLAADARAAKDAADKALGAASAASDDPRLARVAEDRQQIAALKARLDRIETATAAPKSAMRVAASAAPEGGAAARAVAAMAMQRRLAAGEPLAAELAALERLGVAAASLAPLRVFADSGAQSPATFARAFEALAPSLLEASRPGDAAPADPARKILGAMEGLVKIRKVGESRPDDVAGPVASIHAALAAGELARAAAELDGLPPAAREAARGFRESVAARLAADNAAAALVSNAVADLGAGR